MIQPRFLLAPIGLALVLMADPARADIRVTLSSGNNSETMTSTGTANPNSFVGFFSVGGYSFTIQTAFVTTPTSNGGVGQLSSTSIVGMTTGSGTLAPLTVSVQDINSDGSLARFGSTSAASYQVRDSATVTAPMPTTLLLSGSAQLNAADPSGPNNAVAPVGLFLPSSSSGGATNMEMANNVIGGFTLAQTYQLSMVAAGTSGLTIGFNTSISPTINPAVVPEPSSLVLTGLVALGTGGLRIRRRLRARTV